MATQRDQTPQGSLSSGDLIARAQRGEEAAFEQIFHLHKQHVYSVCLRMTGNTAEAEELTQEAFLQVFRKIQTFRGESAFSTWLHRLSVNIVLMRLRKKRVNQTPWDDAIKGEEGDEMPVEFGAPDQVLAGSLDRIRLERAITLLPPGYKQIFLLHDVEGYEHNEIATLLGVSIGNSKSQLHKARARLRKLLLESGRGTHCQKVLYAGAV